MRKNLQRMLNIYQMQLNDIAADTQSMLIEIRIIKRMWKKEIDLLHGEDEKSEE